jgi:hypothetical protein
MGYLPRPGKPCERSDDERNRKDRHAKLQALHVDRHGAVADRDALNAVAWFGFVAAGALTASGTTERSRSLTYLAIALLVVAVAILVGVFLAD